MQGPVEFLDEPGEFALLPATGLLSYWPHDPASLAPGSTTPVVAATSPTAIEFRGKEWLESGEGVERVTTLLMGQLEAAFVLPMYSFCLVPGAGFASDGLLVHDIVILGLEVVGSDFTPDGSYRWVLPEAVSRVQLSARQGTVIQ